jgi:transposase-like protein
MDNARLNRRVGKDGADEIRKALQAVDNRKQDILDAPVPHLIHDPKPEFGSLALLQPETKDLLGAIRPDPERDVHGLVADRAFVPHLDPQGIEENERIDGFERPGLPSRDLLQHGIRDGADEVRRDVDAIEFAQMAHNLARAHAASVHRHDLIVETWKAALILGDELRIEAGLPVPRDLELEPTGLGRHRLAAIAIPAVAVFVGREMMVHLGIQGPLGQRFLQGIEQAIRIKSCFGLGSSQELVQQFVRNMRGFASGHLGASFASILSAPHEIPDRPLRPHRGISQEKLPHYLGFFQFVRNARRRGKALLNALVAGLVT